MAVWIWALLGLAQAMPVEEQARRAIPDDGALSLTTLRPQGARQLAIFGQSHLGLPVAGGRVVVAVEGASARILADSREAALPDALPSLRSPAETAATMAQALPRPGWVEPADRLWWRGRVVDVAHAHSLDGSRSWRLRVDAHSGALLELLPDRFSLGRGKVHDTMPGADHLIEVDLPDLVDGAVGMEGALVDVASQDFGPTGAARRTRYAAPDEGGDYLTDPILGAVDDAFVEVNAYWHVTQTRAFFADTFDHPLPTMIQVTTNYQDAPDTPFDNAYFSYGPGGIYTLTFGQGSVADFGWDPSIIDHEFAHGIVEDLASLFLAMSYPINLDEYGLHAAPGGLTEGLPDYWSSTRTGQSAVGHLDDGSTLRDLDNTATCPESVVGEAHQDGVVIGGATWEIRELLGAERADPLVYRAIGSLSGAPTYAEFGAMLVEAAQSLADEGALTEAEVEAVGAIVDARGLSRCARDVPLAVDTPLVSTMVGADFIDASYCEPLRGLGILIPAPFQLTVEIPADPDGRSVSAVTLDLSFSPLRGAFAEGDLDYAVYVAGDELVRYAINPLNIMGYTFLLPTGAENAIATVEDSPATLTLTAADLGIEAFPAGGSLSFGVIGLNCRTAELTSTAHLTWTDPPVADGDGDALSGGEAKGGGGCGCNSSSGGGLFAALGLLPALLRRRRLA